MTKLLQHKFFQPHRQNLKFKVCRISLTKHSEAIRVIVNNSKTGPRKDKTKGWWIKSFLHYCLTAVLVMSWWKDFLLQTLGSSPNCANWMSLSRLRAVLMMSLHFFGVSSTLPARKRQHPPVTYRYMRQVRNKMYSFNLHSKFCFHCTV